MKLWKIVSSLIFCASIIHTAQAANSAVGNWTVIDDKTGKQRAVVNISESNGKLSGVISKIYPQPGDTGVCAACPGEFKGKKVQGLRIMWGLKSTGTNTWDGGSILDPKSGKIYKLKATLDGNKFHMRGYIGVSMLGRTQTWIKR